MATIDDFGQTNEPLSAPVFGGPSGWAAAVRDAIKSIPTVQGGRAFYVGTGQFERYNFPTPFASTPTVVCSFDSTEAATPCVVSVLEIDPTGFTAALYATPGPDNPPGWFTWIATERTV